MVTQLQKTESKAAESKFQKELATRASQRVTKAVKDRTESFTSLSQAAASSFLFGIQFGRWTEFNRLFNDLAKNPQGRIDADALRQRYVWRVVDKFGAGGVPNLTNDGVQKGWKVRPVPFVQYREKPDEAKGKDQHFSSAEYKGKTPEDERKRKFMAEGKANVIAAGEEGLEAIEWLNRESVIRGDTFYGATKFRKELSRTLRNAIRAMKDDPDTGIAPSTIRAVMRAAGFDREESAAIEKQLIDVATPTKTESVPESESETDKVPASNEKEAA